MDAPTAPGGSSLSAPTETHDLRAPRGRLTLDAGCAGQPWQLCAAAPGAPWPEDDVAWLTIDRLGTAAQSLRQRGDWRMDGPPRRFDAEDWCWRLRFDHPDADAPAGTPWTLGFDGLATLAQVWLNGELLLTSRNMFVAHAIDVGERLRVQGNELRIRCASLDAALAHKRPRPRWRAPMVEHAQLRWFRTTLLGRTPGWSPPAAPVGPWREVWLAARPAPDLRDIALQARLEQGVGLLDLSARLHRLPDQQVASAELVCSRGGQTHSVALDISAEDGAPGDGSLGLKARLRIDGVEAWWPHTHGEPALYDVALRVRIAGQVESFHLPLGPIGFRAVTLDRREGGFALRVNDVPVFCRGACWTPLDPVALRATPEALRAAVRQAREAGMNMLRLAGPMVYEEDAFYDACDAEGVLVWQEFMFANMDYPADDPAFAAEVDAEVRQQLRRLRVHPSLAVLCGNSELEQQAAMWAAPRVLWQPAHFHSTIPALCAELAPDLPYWPSSAHGGAFPFEPRVGTCSYYGVGAYVRGLEDARTSGVRFASECLAFANHPSDDALARAPSEDGEHPYQSQWRAAERDFHVVRDHYFDLFTGLKAEVMQAEDATRFLALSRWVGGHLMSETFAQWRAAGSVCGGGMVWFLRDMRPGPGWGLLDDHGQPKAAWHLLRRALQPVMVALIDQGMNGLDIALVNDHPWPVEARLEVDAWHAGRANIASVARAVTLAPRSALNLPLAGEMDGFMDLGHAYRFGPPPCEVLFARLRDADGRLLAEAIHLPQGLRLPRKDIGLNAQLRRADDEPGAWQVEVSTQAYALGMHVLARGYQPDDDFVHLAPGEQRVITLRPLPSTGTGMPPLVVVAALNTEQRCRVEAS